MKVKEQANWKVRTRLLKYIADIEPFAKEGKEAVFHKLYKPYEVKETEGNLLLNEGINALWSILCETTVAETRYTAANARIGVGNGTTAAAATDTGLAGASTAFKAMESGFPTFGSAQKATFKSSFGDTEANFAWEEWTIDNGATPNKNLNRKAESLGTKSSGTWTLEVSLTLS